MMKRYTILAMLATAALFSCNTKKAKEATGETGKAMKELLPAIRTSDSAVVMYYHTPGDPRFFNMTKVRDLDSLAVVVTDVNSTIIQGKDSCVTQGKIFFYKKEAVYPVYFTRADSCLMFSFIITGEKYKVNMSKKAVVILNDMEKRVQVLSGKQAD